MMMGWLLSVRWKWAKERERGEAVRRSGLYVTALGEAKQTGESEGGGNRSNGPLSLRYCLVGGNSGTLEGGWTA